jgi:hypothetical protein
LRSTFRNSLKLSVSHQYDRKGLPEPQPILR